MENFREELLRKAESFYTKIAAQNSNNEGLRYDVARAHSRLGDINRLLEKHERAVQEYNEAISRFESLAKDYPGRTEYRQALAYAHNWLGETLRIALEQGQLAKFSRTDAEKQYDEALRLQQQIHDEKPANPVYQQELARTYYNRGILSFDNKDLNHAESDFRQAVLLLQPLAERNAGTSADNTNPPPSQELARVYNNLASLLGREGRIPEAAQFSERAIGIQEVLCRKEPNNREYKMELAQFYRTMANVLLYENHIDLAEQRSQQALTLLDELARPASSLGTELAKTRMLRDWLLKSEGQNKR
jgi:tetratricopeptide (TPR) repeat protein